MDPALVGDRCVFGDVFAWDFRDCAFDGKGALGERKCGVYIRGMGDAFGCLRERGCAAHEICDAVHEMLAARLCVSACDVCGRLSVLGRDGMESYEYLFGTECIVGRYAARVVCGEEEA